jgi:hypothetical protein
MKKLLVAAVIFGGIAVGAFIFFGRHFTKSQIEDRLEDLFAPRLESTKHDIIQRPPYHKYFDHANYDTSADFHPQDWIEKWDYENEDQDFRRIIREIKIIEGKPERADVEVTLDEGYPANPDAGVEASLKAYRYRIILVWSSENSQWMITSLVCLNPPE